MMADSESDSELDVFDADDRRPPSTFTYGSSQRKATLPNNTQQTSSQSKATRNEEDQNSDDEEEEILEAPRSSGTVREVHDEEDEVELPKSSDAPVHSSDDFASMPPACQAPSMRQKSVIFNDIEEQEQETQAHSDAAPASESQPDVFGAFFEDTQPFDAQQHGTKADIDIFGNPASTYVPRTLEEDGDETRVNDDQGFDQLRRAQALLRNASPDSFDALPSLPEASMEQDNSDAMDDAELRAMEKQQLILQVERQRANAQADNKPRVMHLNRDGMFTQTEPSQFLFDDTQSQLFTQFSQPDPDFQQQEQNHMPSPAVVQNVDDIFSEDSDRDEPAAPVVPSSPPTTQTRKRKIEALTSSSPLTPLASEATTDSQPIRHKRKIAFPVPESNDEDEQPASSSPSPRKGISRIVDSEDEDEEANVTKAASPRQRKIPLVDASDDEEEDADMSVRAPEDDDADDDADDEGDELDVIKKGKATKAWARADEADDEFTDEEAEESQRTNFMTAAGANNRVPNFQPPLSNYFDVPRPKSAKDDQQTEPTKAKKSAYIAGEAEESEDDERIPGKKSRKGGLGGVFSDDEDAADEEDEDAEDDGKDLEGLVDDVQDEEHLEKDQLVAEKFKQDRAEQDKADEDLHMRATKGQLRKSRPGNGLDNELDDDAQEDLDRRRITQGPQKRKVAGEKDGLDEIQNTALAEVYKEGVRNDVADDADFLEPMDSGSDSDIVDSDNEGGKPGIVSASSVRSEIVARARARKRQQVPDDEDDGAGEVADPTQIGSGSDDEDGFGRVVQIKNYMQSRPILNMREEDDEKHAMDALLNPRKRDEAEKAKLERNAAEFESKAANRKNFLGSGGGGGGRQKNSSVNFKQDQNRRAGGGSGQSGSAGSSSSGAAAVMKSGLGHPSTRRAGTSSAARSTSKLATLLERNRMLKFEENG
ncbi:unnamed protein product [Tilletia controversa]|nr:unnamed protein product [Tilletia controversa]